MAAVLGTLVMGVVRCGMVWYAMVVCNARRAVWFGWYGGMQWRGQAILASQVARS